MNYWRKCYLHFLIEETILQLVNTTKSCGDLKEAAELGERRAKTLDKRCIDKNVKNILTVSKRKKFG